MGPESNNWCHYNRKEEEIQTDTHTQGLESSMETEAEIREMCLQAKQRIAENRQKLEEAEDSSLEPSEGVQPC